MKLREILFEEYYSTVATRYGYAEIYLNPTKRELIELAKINEKRVGEDEVRLILEDDKCYAWPSFQTLHSNIIKHYQFNNPISLYCEPYNNLLKISASSKSGGTESEILNHPWVKEVLGNPHITH